MLIRFSLHTIALFPQQIYFYNVLPFAADVVRLAPLAEVASELVNGKEPSEHNVSRQTEETG